MTPTAMIADYVLPAAGAIERPVLQVHGGVANMGYGGPAAVEPYYERRTDYDVFRGLGLRLGQEDAWPEETLADAFAAQLARAGMDLSLIHISRRLGRPGQPVRLPRVQRKRADLGR